MDELLKAIMASPNPAEEIKGLIAGVKPSLYLVAGELFEIYKDLITNEELAKTTAQGYWNDYKALLDVGFDENDAMTILLARIRAFQDIARNSGANVKLNK